MQEFFFLYGNVTIVYSSLKYEIGGGALSTRNYLKKEMFLSISLKDKNDKELPNLPFSCYFFARKHDTREDIAPLFALASALIGGNVLISQNIARMFT